MRAIRGWSEIDRREFAVKWENIRAAYFENNGQPEKAKNLRYKADTLRRELDFLQYGQSSQYQ